MGLLVDSQPAMGANTSPERMESTSWTRAPQSTETVPAAMDGARMTAGQAYMEISSRTDYKATTSDDGGRVTYAVQPGDSLWQIADKYDTDLATLLSLNPHLDTTVIQPGEELQVIPHFRGLVHTVSPGETLSEISMLYGLSIQAMMEANQLSSSEHLQVDQVLLLPGAQLHMERSMVASSRGGTARRSASEPALGWVWPITGGLHSSEFGEARWGTVHTGIDVAVPTGTPAVAVASGTVTFSGWDGGYGYTVIIDHGSGLQTRYAHASKVLVAQGQEVAQGENVILVGATGNSTGPHLHFEVLVDGTAKNPRLYLP